MLRGMYFKFSLNSGDAIFKCYCFPNRNVSFSEKETPLNYVNTICILSVFVNIDEFQFNKALKK